MQIDCGVEMSCKAKRSKCGDGTYVEPVAGPTAVHRELAALVPVHDRLDMIDRFVRLDGLRLQVLGHIQPSLLVDDRELVPAVIVEERQHRLGHLKKSIEKGRKKIVFIANRSDSTRGVTHLSIWRLGASKRWDF